MLIISSHFLDGQSTIDYHSSLGNSMSDNSNSTLPGDEISSRKSLTATAVDVHLTTVAHRQDQSQQSVLLYQLPPQATLPEAEDYSPPTDVETHVLPQSDFRRPTIAWMTDNRASHDTLGAATTTNNNSGQQSSGVAANSFTRTVDIGHTAADTGQSASRIEITASKNANSRLPVPVERTVRSINQAERISSLSPVTSTRRQQTISSAEHKKQRAAFSVTASAPAASDAMSALAASTIASKPRIVTSPSSKSSNTATKIDTVTAASVTTTKPVNKEMTTNNVTITLDSSPTSGLASLTEQQSKMTTTLALHDKYVNAGNQTRLQQQSRHQDKQQEVCCQYTPGVASSQPALESAISRHSAETTNVGINMPSLTDSKMSIYREASKAIDSELMLTTAAPSSSTSHSVQPTAITTVTSIADTMKTTTRNHHQLRQSLPSANSNQKMVDGSRKFVMAVKKLPSMLSSSRKNSIIKGSPSATKDSLHPVEDPRPAREEDNDSQFARLDNEQSNLPWNDTHSQFIPTSVTTASDSSKATVADGYYSGLQQQGIVNLSSNSKSTTPNAKAAAAVSPPSTSSHGAPLSENQALGHKVAWSSPIASTTETGNMLSAKFTATAAAGSSGSSSSSKNGADLHYAAPTMSETQHIDYVTAPKRKLDGYSMTAGNRIISVRRSTNAVASNARPHFTERNAERTTANYVTAHVNNTTGDKGETHRPTAAVAKTTENYRPSAYDNTLDMGSNNYHWPQNNLQLSRPSRVQLEAQTAVDVDQAAAFHNDRSPLVIDQQNTLNQSNNVAKGRKSSERKHVSLLQASNTVKSIGKSATRRQPKPPETSVTLSSSANHKTATVPSHSNDGRFFDRNNRASHLRSVATNSLRLKKSSLSRPHRRMRRTVTRKGNLRPTANAAQQYAAYAARGHDHAAAKRETAGLAQATQALIEESNRGQAFTSQPTVVGYSYDNGTREQLIDNKNNYSVIDNSYLWSAIDCACKQLHTCDVQRHAEQSKTDTLPNWNESTQELPTEAEIEDSNEEWTTTGDERVPSWSKTTFIVQHRNRQHRSIVASAVKPPPQSTLLRQRETATRSSGVPPEMTYYSRRLLRR